MNDNHDDLSRCSVASCTTTSTAWTGRCCGLTDVKGKRPSIRRRRRRSRWAGVAAAVAVIVPSGGARRPRRTDRASRLRRRRRRRPERPATSRRWRSRRVGPPAAAPRRSEYFTDGRPARSLHGRDRHAARVDSELVRRR